MATSSLHQIEKLDEDNFLTWAMQVQAILVHSGLQNALKAEPAANDATAKDKDEKAMATIMLALKPAQLMQVRHCKTAKEMWDKLKEVYQPQGPGRKVLLFKRLLQRKLEEKGNMVEHIRTFHEIVDQLQEIGVEMPDEVLVIMLLSSLPKGYDNFVVAIEARDGLPTFSKLMVKLKEEDQRRLCESDSLVDSQQAFLTHKKGNGRNNKGGNRQENGDSGKKNDICKYCKKKGHWVRECRKWISDGRPSKRQSEKVNGESSVMTAYAFVSDTNTSEEDWYIDNGATRHITNTPKYFVDFKRFENPCSIQAAGKEVLTAIGSGTIRFVSNVNNRRSTLTLIDVWYVPNVSRNLFSVLAAQDKQLNSVFKSKTTKCWLTVNGKLVLCGERQRNASLFKVDIKPIASKAETDVYCALSDDSLLQLYHERWGHQDKRHVKKVLERVSGIKVNMTNQICEPCIYGKAHRLPFGSRPKATIPGELVSADVCGPFENESFQKKRYFVLFKDSFTKFRFCVFMREKSEVSNALESFLAHVVAQGHVVKELLTDNGGEFENAAVKRILGKHGIGHRLTAPYTPEQNGLSERENRTLVEMARTFMYSNEDAHFPKALWAELVRTAVYVLNRTGKSSVEDKTPHELWFGKTPRIHHLRIIGSTCYAHVPGERRRKMDMKAIKGYLVGYDGEERYRIYVKEDSKIITSRDVKFQEKPENCTESVKLPISLSQQGTEGTKDFDNQDDVSNGEKESEHHESGEEPEASEDSNEEGQTSRYNLRSRSGLKRPDYFEALQAEELVKEINTPESYQDAVESRERASWAKAMDSEINSLKENGTWELVNLPGNAKALPCKWVYRVKTNPDGSIDKFKARLVIKGFKQIHGVDYNQTFSPVAKTQTIRSILGIAAIEQMHLAQFDVSTAFLYGELEEVIYMKQPEGFDDGSGRVCLLKKSLYGLKQAPRCWHKRFGNFLLKLGFTVSEADPCLFIRDKGNSKLILVLYVDDGLLAAKDLSDLSRFIEELKAEFKITTKEADYFLGLQIEAKDDYIKISQEAYAKRILERFNMANCKAVATPMTRGTETNEKGKADEGRKFPYRQAVGALMYLMLGTRPDLAYSVGYLSRTLENPQEEDVIRLKRVFRYIAGTLSKSITFERDSEAKLECYSDADFGGCVKSGRSTTGVVIMYAGGAISWLSQRQSMVATSTTEAEIVAANEAAKEIIWLSRLFEGISKLKEIPVLQVDNSAAVRLAQNPEFHRRTKHIAMKHFFVREKILEGLLQIQQISTEDQVADIMTKPLERVRMNILCQKMGLND